MVEVAQYLQSQRDDKILRNKRVKVMTDYEHGINKSLLEEASARKGLSDELRVISKSNKVTTFN